VIYPRGKNGTYWLRFRFAGRVVHESTRTTSKTLAREAERQRRHQLAEQFNGVQKRTLPPTVSRASKLWIEKRVGLAEGTRETYEAALLHVKAKLGTLLVCEVTARDLAEYQKRRLAEKAAGATINKEIACISSILSDHGSWQRIRRDVKRLPENEEAGRALEPEEERMLLENASAAGEHQGKWTPIYTVTVLGLNTGMRHKEIRTLRWKDIDLESGVLRVAESKTKAGEGRPIPFTQPARAALQFWAGKFPKRRTEDFVFPACENGQVDLTRGIANWRTAWRRITRSIECKECGEIQSPRKFCRNVECHAKIDGMKNALDGLRFHDLRHSTATKLLEQGTPLPVVAQILGWSASTAVRMIKRYGHIRPEAQRQALAGVATKEIQTGVHQFVHQPGRGLQSTLPN
jgi:integrase